MGARPPPQARPREASAEPPVAASTPCHHLPSGPGPQGASGQMGLRIRPASAPPRPSSDPGHQRAKMATLALLASVPSGVLLGPLGRDLNWSR